MANQSTNERALDFIDEAKRRGYSPKLVEISGKTYRVELDGEEARDEYDLRSVKL